jgi:hypothetical protein
MLADLRAMRTEIDQALAAGEALAPALAVWQAAQKPQEPPLVSHGPEGAPASPTVLPLGVAAVAVAGTELEARREYRRLISRAYRVRRRTERQRQVEPVAPEPGGEAEAAPAVRALRRAVRAGPPGPQVLQQQLQVRGGEGAAGSTEAVRRVAGADPGAAGPPRRARS